MEAEEKKLSKRQLKRQKKQREEEIRQAELARVEGQVTLPHNLCFGRGFCKLWPSIFGSMHSFMVKIA